MAFALIIEIRLDEKLFQPYTVMKNEYSTLAKEDLCKWGHFERAKTIFKIVPVS